MQVADRGVWIDYFNGADNPAVEALDDLLNDGELRIVVPDLVLFEVLRGFRLERELRQARLLMETFEIAGTTSPDLASAAVDHYRALRAAGITVRSSIDVLIATFCIERDYALLHRDRDYEPFAAKRGLRVWNA